MAEDKITPPTNERLRRPKPNVIDQRQQQIDPAGHAREDHNARPDGNRKQPGGGEADHQTNDDSPNGDDR